MALILSEQVSVSPVNSLESVRPRMVRARLKNFEPHDFPRLIGLAIQRAISLVGWTNKEAAAAIAVALGREKFDQAQLSRWIGGTETPQFSALFAVEPLRWPLVQSLAALAQADVVTEIRKRA